ncbi:ShlB/FhaC/HecB family hemolysin secretion/activation protein [Limnobacter sp.]|uniref:ShlB/FhaC/HecB family hemolysin secretion/activation protein n=1 Tax=Limnobacter sp. TaxID=2003368 RepID=UPI0027BA3DC0|nr:ShlB/FhaC/HecB family hemolysin secretion/activation protein [Limnobacter sp.]
MKFKLSAVACAVVLLVNSHLQLANAQTLPESTSGSQPSSEEYKEPSFAVSGFEVLGPELIPRDQVMAVLSGFSGREITFSDLRTATVAVEQLHAEAGYEVVRVLIPEQEIKPGEQLKLQIVDARLDVVTVAGNDYFTAESIQESLVVLQPGALINTVDMDKNLRLINDNPAKIVRVRLEPSDKPGLVDAKVQVSDQKPLAAYLTLDNSGTNATGDFRMGLALQHNNAFNKGHMASFQYVTSPGRWSDVEVFGLNYKVPFYSISSMLELAYSDSNVDAGNIGLPGGAALSVVGAGTSAAIRWVKLLDRLAGFDARLTFSHEIKQFVSDVRIVGGAQVPIPNLESRPVGVSYSLSEALDSRQRAFQIGYFKNYVTGGNNSTTQYRMTNPAAEANFDVIRANASWSEQVMPGWRLTAQLDAQHTDYSLIPGEQFGAGGVYSVRGFEERVISADRGTRQSLELMGPNVSKKFGTLFERLQFVGFVDAAQLKFNNPVFGSPVEPHLMSYGVGARFAFSPKHQFRVDLAKVVSGVPIQPHGDVMLHVTFATSL